MKPLRWGLWIVAWASIHNGFAADEPTNADVIQRMKVIEDSLHERIDWSGELESTVNAHRDPIAARSTPNDAVVRAHLRPKLDIQKRYFLKTDLLLRADSANSTRNTIRLDEGYASAQIPGTKLTARAGKIIYHWGNDAIFNPTDFLNPIDYYDFYHIDKLGVFAVDMNYAASDTVSFDFGVIPIVQPSIISDPTSRWINYSTFVSKAVTSRLSLPANLPSDYTVPFDLEQRAPKYPQIFARANFKTLNFDFSAAYSFRYNPAPQVLLFESDVRFDAINSLPAGTITGIPYYQQEHLLAADLSVPVFGSVFFMNSTLNLPNDSQPDLPSNTAILSNLNSLGLGGTVTSTEIEDSRKSSILIFTTGVRKDWSKFHAYLQYARIWYLRGNAPAALLGKITNGVGVNPSDVYDFFSGTFMPGFSWDFYRKFNVHAGAVLNTKSSGIIGETGLNYTFADGFKGTLLYDYVDGKQGTLLSYYSGNSRLSLNLSLVF